MAIVLPQTRICSTPRPYTGRELRPHWIYQTFDIQGDAIVAFSGPVEVKIDSMVDMADRRDGLFISGDSMLHFIYESFGPDLDRSVHLQKLLVLLAFEILRESLGERVRRKGDDIFLDDGKMSVSIATVSLVSCLIHFGMNISNKGTPLKTGAFEDSPLDSQEFAKTLMARMTNELRSMNLATTKVRGVQ